MSLPPSPFLSKIGTDFVPSSTEKVEIRQLILAKQERLAQLQAEQEELQSFIDNHLQLVAPIRQVHADILREIFHRCIPEHEVPAPCALDAPLLLTRVCRLWREVAIGSPNLWNRIHIHFPRVKANGPGITDEARLFLHRWREGVHTWLQRSGTVPLILSISTNTVSLEASISHTFHADVIRHLLLHAPRWRSLSLKSPSADIICRKLAESTAELSLLVELKSTAGFDLDSLKDVLQRAPSLRKLELDRLYVSFPVHWNRLTEVVFRSPTWPNDCLTPTQAIQILSSSHSSLRHFTFSIRQEIGHLPDTPITLPNLQTLNIEANGTTAAQRSSELTLVALGYFLHRLNAPQLVEFCLKSTMSDLPLSSVEGFLAHSQCALRSLVLDFAAKGPDLVRLLASAPTLKHLKVIPLVIGVESDVSDWHLPEGLLDSLTPSQSQQTKGTVLCPNLEFLVVRNCPAIYAVPIFALAEARCTEPLVTRKLKRLQVCFRGKVTSEGTEVSSGVEVLRNKGMLVQLFASKNPYAKLVTASPGPDFCDYVHSGEIWWPSRFASPSDILITWPNDCLTPSQAIQILSSSHSSLRHFTFSIRNEVERLPDTPIMLPNLQTLNIEANGLPSLQRTFELLLIALDHFLNCLNAPQLVEFCLTSTMSDLPLSSVEEFLIRSKCALRSLVLDFPAKGADAVGLLASVPTLKHLKVIPLVTGVESDVSDWHLPGGLLDSLTPSQSQQTVDTVLCPDLELLMVRNCPPTYAVPIFAVAEARCTEPLVSQKLKRLQVGFRGKVTSEGMEISSGVEVLRNRGVLVQLFASKNPHVKFVTTSPGPDFRNYIHSGEMWWPALGVNIIT
ncbi:hypothetical protein VNI00_008550 [Paramarasmius palmivorus]|uniref:F-box domain-containing protein n=1 Tax=Paramarasmius palmivorus TaxID=297713 RepID=A0AAW0CWA2_9AGAR